MTAVLLAIACIASPGTMLLAGSMPVTVRPDTLDEVQLVARFERASSVAVSPAGHVYVADAGPDTVVRLASDGEVVEVIGGPGTDASRFDDPYGVDPTNGLILLVADAGNGRIQRFARDGRFLDYIPVFSSTDPFEGDPEYMARDAGVAVRADGRPVDVVATDDGSLYAVEAVSGTVRSWDRERRPRPVIGMGSGDDLPVGPVALATDGRQVFVADALLPGVVVLDGFGRSARSFGTGVGEGIVSVTVGGGCAWLVLADRLVAFSPEGTRQVEYRVTVDGPLVDAAVRDDAVYLLTANALYRASGSCDG